MLNDTKAFCDIAIYIYIVIRGVPNILRQPAEAEHSAVWPNILPKPNRGSLFAEYHYSARKFKL